MNFLPTYLIVYDEMSLWNEFMVDHTTAIVENDKHQQIDQIVSLKTFGLIYLGR